MDKRVIKIKKYELNVYEYNKNIQYRLKPKNTKFNITNK